MLSNERKLEIYTERLWRLALDLALQSSLGGKERHGIAIVAEETRNISGRLYRLLEDEDSETIRVSIGDALVELQALMLNGWIEMLRVYKAGESDNPLTGPAAILLEEIRSAANDIRGLFGLPPGLYSDLPQPELKHKSSITNTKLFLVQATIGGIPFVENTAYIQEIVSYIDGDEGFGIRDGYVILRGKKIPVIDCYARFGLEHPGAIDSTGRKCAIIISTAWEKEPERYAVLVDALPLSFGFYVCFSEGQNVQSRSEVFANRYVRASWDTTDEGQMLFLNWKALK